MTDIVEHLRAALAICTDPFTRSDLTAAITEIEALRAEVENLRERRHVPFGEIETLRATIDAASKLLMTDEKVEFPQPHPPLLSQCAGARIAMRDMGAEHQTDLHRQEALDDINVNLQAEIETLRTHIRGLFTVIEKQEHYVSFHILRTGETLTAEEVAPFQKICADAREAMSQWPT